MDRLLELSPKDIRIILVALRHYEDDVDSAQDCPDLNEYDVASNIDDMNVIRSLIGRLER